MRALSLIISVERPGFRRDAFGAEVGAQSFGHEHAAVLLLVVLDNRDPGAADGQAAAVQRMDEFGFPFAAIWTRMDARRAWNASKFEQDEISL